MVQQNEFMEGTYTTVKTEETIKFYTKLGTQ